MQYTVISKKGEDKSVGVETVYFHVPSDQYWEVPGGFTVKAQAKRCLRMQDADGDSIPDKCESGPVKKCNEEGEFSKVKCVGRHNSYFKIAEKLFNEYIAGSDLSKMWQLDAVSRKDGVTNATYTCGDGCIITLTDRSSDGKVDEAFMKLNYYSVSFLGDMPNSAHQMLQPAILTALDHFLPGTFSPFFDEGGTWEVGADEEDWKVGTIAFVKSFNFFFNAHNSSDSFILSGDNPLTFAPDPEAAPIDPKESVGGSTSHILISESGSKMKDVTEDYSE